MLQSHKGKCSHSSQRVHTCMPVCLCSVCVTAQVMHFVAMSRSRTRTRRRSAPQMWTMMAVILPARWRTAWWKAAAASTTRPDGGLTSVAWQTSMALLRTWSRARGRGHTSCGTPGDRTGSLTSSNLSRWRSGRLQQITDGDEEVRRRKRGTKDILLLFCAQHLILIIQDGWKIFIVSLTCYELKSSLNDLFIIYTLHGSNPKINCAENVGLGSGNSALSPLSHPLSKRNQKNPTNKQCGSPETSWTS